MSVVPLGLGESAALIHYASAGLVPVRSDKWQLHLARKPTSVFPGIAGGDSEKNKNVRGELGICHLYPRPGQGESTALIHHASAGLAPVRSDKWRLHLARKPTSIFPGIAGSDSGKNKNVRGGLGSCHLYPRPGRARRKILIMKHGSIRDNKAVLSPWVVAGDGDLGLKSEAINCRRSATQVFCSRVPW